MSGPWHILLGSPQFMGGGGGWGGRPVVGLPPHDRAKTKQSKHWSKVDWSKVDWSKVDWSKVDWSKVDWSKVDWSKVDWSKVD